MADTSADGDHELRRELPNTGQKHAAEKVEVKKEIYAEDTTRVAKGPTTSDGGMDKFSTQNRRGRSSKTHITANTFKSRAPPLHVILTETPPGDNDDDESALETTDPGYVAVAELVPCRLSSGTYGWKGAKEFALELKGEEGHKTERVHVVWTMSAVVVPCEAAGDLEGEDICDELVEALPEDGRVLSRDFAYAVGLDNKRAAEKVKAEADLAMAAAEAGLEAEAGALDQDRIPR
ncbi:hypothetical protein OBBRIDRAFT_825808 [Obba rivulosa]|uniref:Uncharacterized protein n=1 Tax=Obba rivulosa TaxID=1052685 RepID=A0A8E2AWT8_9APHY|nr:hypothetical protein OBBRIDRAFT_825808 [Obba rivulosa]